MRRIMKKAKRKIFTLVVVLIGAWIASPVSSAWASEREETLEIIRALIPEVRKESIQRMTSPHAAQAYLNFIKLAQTPEVPFRVQTQPFGCKQRSCTDEQVKAYFHDHISKKIVRAIHDVPVIYLESELPKKVKRNFRKNEERVAVYYTRENKIYLHLRRLEGDGEMYLKQVLREEFEHAIDRNIFFRDLFPKTQHSDSATKYALSGILYENQIEDIIRPEAREWYQAHPQELYAKFQLIKTVLRQKHPKLFYSNGNIRRKAVVLFFRSPQSFVDIFEVDIAVVHVLQKSKIKEIQRFINQLV